MWTPLVGQDGGDQTHSQAMRPMAMSIMALGLFLMFFLGNQLSFWGFYALVLLRGMGSGLFLTPNNTAILNSLPAQWRGFATGSLETDPPPVVVPVLTSLLTTYTREHRKHYNQALRELNRASG